MSFFINPLLKAKFRVLNFHKVFQLLLHRTSFSVASVTFVVSVGLKKNPITSTSPDGDKSREIR